MREVIRGDLVASWPRSLHFPVREKIGTGVNCAKEMLMFIDVVDAVIRTR